MSDQVRNSEDRSSHDGDQIVIFTADMGHVVRSILGGCTSFCLNPFRRIDTSSNTIIGLKYLSGRTLHQNKIKDLRQNVAPLLFFVSFDFSHLFPPIFRRSVLLQKCSTVVFTIVNC